MNLLLIMFGVFFLTGLVAGVGWLVVAYSNENRQLTASPKTVAGEVASLYREDRVAEIEPLLNKKTTDWKEKDWKKFHKERDKEIGSAKDAQSQISAEVETLKELKKSDKRIEEAKRELIQKPDDELDEWQKKFNNEK